MSGFQYYMETGVQAISLRTGQYGLAISAGWEGGRIIANQPSYRIHVRPHLQNALNIPRDEYYQKSKYNCINCVNILDFIGEDK